MKNVICFNCGTKNEYEMRTVTRQYIGEGYSFSMDIELPFCKKCGALITMEEIEQEIAEKANKNIRERKDIIQKEEIRGIWSKYNVSQKMLSRLLGWGEITLTRYVTGGYTPNAVNSEKLKSLNNPYIFQKMLNDNQIDEHSYSFEKLNISVNCRLKEIEEHKGKIYDFAAEGAKQCDKIEDYHIAELPKHGGECPHLPYEPLKHYFKIYINNFPGAKELRAKLMETHSVAEARKILQNL